MTEHPHKAYLGDGAYVQVGSWAGEVILTTSDGVQDLNRIHLDESCTRSLLQWLEERRLDAMAARSKEPEERFRS